MFEFTCQYMVIWLTGDVVLGSLNHMFLDIWSDYRKH